jgi:hypothetical protein
VVNAAISGVSCDFIGKQGAKPICTFSFQGKEIKFLNTGCVPVVKRFIRSSQKYFSISQFFERLEIYL